MNPVQKSAILLDRLLTKHSSDHLQAGITQLADPSTSNPGVGILQSNNDTPDASSEHSLTARRGAAVMAAGLQGHHQRSIPRRCTGLPESTHFGVR